MLLFEPTFIFYIFLLPLLVVGQLTGRVGPTTSLSAKRARKVCNISDHGGRQGKNLDIGPALTAAFNACKAGGLIVIPPGEYGLATWVEFRGGSGWALQWDGTIQRTGNGGGNMLLVQGGKDIEFFSSTGKGAFQGNGYEFHQKGSITGPRILRFVRVSNFAVHDLAFADAPSFHFSMDHCDSGEVYNMAIRGANQGGLDGIDVWSDNMHIHDIMVTNKDECVTVKSPAHHILIENIYCNWSGGSAFGSLGVDVDISNIIYRNIYTYKSNQMMMIKSKGGSGTMKNVLMENFIGYGNAWSLDIDQQWGNIKQPNPGSGVDLANITFKGWRGTCEDGNRRGPIKIVCESGTPSHSHCINIHIDDFAMWTDSGSTIWYSCQNAYGSGACLKPGVAGDYAPVKQIKTAPPANYKAPKMPWDLKDSFGTTKPIPIPQIPDYFFPGTKPLKALARDGRGSGRAEAPDRQPGPVNQPKEVAPPDNLSPTRGPGTSKGSAKGQDPSSSSKGGNGSGSRSGPKGGSGASKGPAALLVDLPDPQISLDTEEQDTVNGEGNPPSRQDLPSLLDMANLASSGVSPSSDNEISRPSFANNPTLHRKRRRSRRLSRVS